MAVGQRTIVHTQELGAERLAHGGCDDAEVEAKTAATWATFFESRGGSHSDVIYRSMTLFEVDYVTTFQVGHKHVMNDVEKSFGVRTFCVSPPFSLELHVAVLPSRRHR